MSVNRFIVRAGLVFGILLLVGCTANEGAGPVVVKAEAVSPESDTTKAAAPVSALVRNGRHTGYYYPDSGSVEVYQARSKQLGHANRTTRLGFVTGITKQQQERYYPPRFAIFAKGTKAEKLIIIGLDGQTFSSLYRARAALAQMTAMARLTPLFKQLGVQEYFTFFDLAKLLGFRDITVSDGQTWSHRIDIR